MNTQVGLVCGAITGKIYAVINPDDDAELDNPRWLLIKLGTLKPQEDWQPPDDDPNASAPLVPNDREPLLLLRMPLEDYMACGHHDEVQAFATRVFQIAVHT